MEVFQKAKNRASIWPSNDIPDIYQKTKQNNKKKNPPKTPIWKDTKYTYCKDIVYNGQNMKQLKCPSTYEWINMWNGILFNHKKEWHFAISNNMDGLEDIMLSEIRQTDNTVW